MNSTGIELPSNKKFGFFFCIIFLIISLYFFYTKNQSLGYIFVIFTVVFFITTLVNAKLLFPLNKLWMNFGLLLGKIVSPIVLGIIFFVLFTFYAIIMKIVGRDELKLKKLKNQSHWNNRSNSSNVTNFRKQY